MFAFDRSALAVLVPLAMLAAVVFWSNQPQPAASAQDDPPALEENQTVAANLPSR